MNLATVNADDPEWDQRGEELTAQGAGKSRRNQTGKRAPLPSADARGRADRVRVLLRPGQGDGAPRDRSPGVPDRARACKIHRLTDGAYERSGSDAGESVRRARKPPRKRAASVEAASLEPPGAAARGRQGYNRVTASRSTSGGSSRKTGARSACSTTPTKPRCEFET